MKSRVDLYVDTLKPKYELFTLGTCLVIWGATLLFIGVGVWWSKAQFNQTVRDSQYIENSYQSKKNVVDTLTSERDSRQRDQQLVMTIEELQKQLSGREAILAELEKQEQLKTQVFSLLMLDLATNQQDDLWLTRIRAEEQDLLMVGGASTSSSLPKWVSKLQNAQYFSGKQFDAAKLYRDEQDSLVFEIGTFVDEENITQGAAQ